MEWYHATLGAVTLAALVLSWNVPRCGKWIFIASASYVASVLYHRLAPASDTLPLGAHIAFLCDAAVYVIIKQMHQERWEFWGLGSIAMFMAVFNLVQALAMTFGFPPVMPHTVYSSILEVANLAYLSIIGGVGLADLMGHGNDAYVVDHRRHSSLSGRVSAAIAWARKQSRVRKLTF